MKRVVIVALFLLAFPAAASAEYRIATPKYWNTGLATKPGGIYKRFIHSETPLGHNAGLLVLGQREVAGETWVALRGPWRPNQKPLWAPERKFFFSSARAALRLDLSSRKLVFFFSGERLWRAKVVVGAPDRPTPTGLFALYDFHRSRGAMRPWVFETTAHSKVLQSFMGGEARVALHGRHDWLRAPWGSASSNGCIRTPDWALEKIRKHLRLGMPLLVRG